VPDSADFFPEMAEDAAALPMIYTSGYFSHLNISPNLICLAHGSHLPSIKPGNRRVTFAITGFRKAPAWR
jgi:hypothetical protein